VPPAFKSAKHLPDFLAIATIVHFDLFIAKHLPDFLAIATIIK